MDWVCFLLCLPLLFSSFSESCLDGKSERLISGNKYRVQGKFFKASSVDSSYTPVQARLEGQSWCSSDSLRVSERPWLQVTFGMKFNISIIQTGGFNGFNDYYLTSFQVYIDNGTVGSLRPLTISDDPMQPMVFRRMETYDVENTVLPSPVITQVLRIVAVEWYPRNQVCLRLEALGCLPSPDAKYVSAVDLMSKLDIMDIYDTTSLVVPTTAMPNTEGSPHSTQETSPTEQVSDASSYTTQETSPTEEVSDASSYTTQDTPHTKEISEASSNTTQETTPTEEISEASSYTTRETLPTEEITEASSADEISESSSYTTQDTPPTKEISETSSYTTQEMRLGSPHGLSIVGIVGVVVGGGLGLLLALLLLGIMVVAIVVFVRRSTQLQLSENQEDDSEHKFDNSIYGIKMLPLHNSPEHNFDNSIYGEEPGLPNLYEELTKSTSRGEFNTDYHQDRPDIASSITSNIYCSIPASTAIFHEPIQHANGTLDTHEEMNNNDLYATCSEELKMECDLVRQDIPTCLPSNISELITSATTAILHEPIQDLNETIDPHNQQMCDNPLYGEHVN